MTIDFDDVLGGVATWCTHHSEHNLVNKVAILADCAEMDGVRGKV